MFKYITAFSLHYSLMGKMLLINILTINMLIDGRDKLPGRNLTSHHHHQKLFQLLAAISLTCHHLTQGLEGLAGSYTNSSKFPWHTLLKGLPQASQSKGWIGAVFDLHMTKPFWTSLCYLMVYGDVPTTIVMLTIPLLTKKTIMEETNGTEIQTCRLRYQILT